MQGRINQINNNKPKKNLSEYPTLNNNNVNVINLMSFLYFSFENCDILIQKLLQRCLK